MTTDSADYSPHMPDKPVSVDELFRDIPAQSVEDLVCEGIFDSDEDLDEFIQHVYAARRADLA